MRKITSNQTIMYIKDCTLHTSCIDGCAGCSNSVKLQHGDIIESDRGIVIEQRTDKKDRLFIFAHKLTVSNTILRRHYGSNVALEITEISNQLELPL